MNKIVNSVPVSLDTIKEVHGFILNTLELALLNERTVSEDDLRIVDLIDVTADSVIFEYDGQVYSIQIKIELIPNLTKKQAFECER